ncbi:GMP synthase, partial [Candidatus Bathyarchaeota archaeon]
KTRVYGDILAIKSTGEGGGIIKREITHLLDLQRAILQDRRDFTHVLYMIAERGVDKPYVIVIRAVETEDFLTADVSNLPWKSLEEIAYEIMEECRDVSEVYYDITPKPPATIEME